MGDVIIVDGGTHGPLVIDKALTIVGVDSNPPFIRNALPGAVPPFSPVHLAGPGSGVVTLSKMVIGGTVDGAFFSLPHQGISGGGFDELRITHSQVDAPFWSNFTGIARRWPARARSPRG